MKASNVMLSVVAGAAVGAVLGILYAPDKGINTRKKITQKSGQYAQGLKDQVNHVAELVSSPFHTTRREANGLAENPRMKLSEVKK